MKLPLENFSVLAQINIFFPNILYATLVGAIIGLEREFRQKEAGIKTNIVICVGAYLFTHIGFLIANSYNTQPDRIIAQIVSGLGFLGAGLIYRSDRVRGVTTAALIWLVASFGVLIGLGGGLITLLLAFGFVILNITLNKVTPLFFKHKSD